MTRSRCVAHILPFPAVGGTEIATRRVADAASEHGYRSIAFCPDGAEPVRELFAGAGHSVRNYTPVEPSYRAPASFLANSIRLARELRREDVDLVHCSDVLGAFFAGFAARLARVPLLCHVRNRYAEMSRRDRSFLLPVQRFAFVSQDTWRHFAHPVSTGRGTVLYDGIEIPDLSAASADRQAIRREFGIPEHAPVIGMVARVAPQKDFPTLIEAMEKLREPYPELRIVIVGDHSGNDALREHYDEVMRNITARGLERHFIFAAYRTDVPRFLNAVDVFALCTHWEGLPLVLLEAMAHQLPVVATAVDGVPELIADGDTGYLHDHGDADGLASRLRHLLDHPDRALEMGAFGRSHVAGQFSRARFTADVGRLYSGMLRAAPPVPPVPEEGRRRVARPVTPGGAD